MGRSKIINICLLLLLLLSIIGCQRAGFDKFEGPNFSYQIGANKKDIIRLRFTTDEGAASIQLFDTNGRFREEAIIAQSWPFQITAIKNNTIQLTYFVGERDLKIFLNWFKKKKTKYYPTKIGNYSILYTYEIRNEFNIDQNPVQVDSLYIDKNTQIMSLFLQQKLIVKEPMYLFWVKSSELDLYDSVHKSNIPFIFVGNKNITEDYLKKILALY
ncbi:hypothetical protein DRF59_20535 [Chryseobacterium flavum]|uniref:Uncharacterized protein n=1 Tax=Chryseobacterium flavum TaxID=415851 RepID=A0A3D9CFI3_9FLAO|nr:hypothetical protein [Chryseobacterium flavum]REC64518.1 hypothetical protein DRF59_20535 [Chryseobacterium flavum]